MRHRTPAALWLLLPLLVLAGAAGAEEPEFDSRKARAAAKEVTKKRAAAREELQEAAGAAQKTYAKALRKALKAVMRAGDLAEAERIDGALKWLAEAQQDTARGIVDAGALDDPSELSAEEALAAQLAYLEAVQGAREAFADATVACLKTYQRKLEAALKRAMRSADLAEAKLIQATIERVSGEIEAVEARDRWVVLFRSQRPEDWNTSIRDGARYAVPLSRAPRTLRFLRLRRVDTGEAVIISLRFEQLGQDVRRGDHGWNGAKVVNEGGVHLGIDAAKWHLTFRDGGRIMVSNGSGNAGWGFGHKVHVNDVQYWSWNGQEIPPVAFEIAVTARDLSDAERAQRLDADADAEREGEGR